MPKKVVFAGLASIIGGDIVEGNWLKHAENYVILPRKLNETFGNGVFDKTCRGFESQFLNKMAAVGFNGANTDFEGGGDILIGFAFSYTTQDFFFSGSQNF